eukprot:GEMP01018912.1.p1 GENE.GEMP01018912.1~~GEMP01018912.1.p1  ORF type:complete len:165 (-),score=42.75 GEMP01018912.1:1898-2392(-)
MSSAKESAGTKRIYKKYFSSLDTDELQDLAKQRGISSAKKGLLDRVVEYESYPNRRQSLTMSKRTVKRADSDGEVTPSERKKPSRSDTPAKSANKRQSMTGSSPKQKQKKSKSSDDISSTDRAMEIAQKIGPINMFPKLLYASIFVSATLAVGIAAKIIHDSYV